MRLFSSTPSDKKPPVVMTSSEDVLEVPGATNADKIIADIQQLQNELNGADLSRARDILAELQSLSSNLQSVASEGGVDQRKVTRYMRQADMAVAQAMGQVRAQHADNVEDTRSMIASQALQVGLYTTMSVAQKHFFHAIEQKDSYVLTNITADGKMEPVADPAQQKVVTKEELKEKFNILHYHSLPKEEQEKLVRTTFGIDAKDDDTNLTPDKIAAKLAELKDLRAALGDMEAYKAYLILSKGNKEDIRQTLGQIAHIHGMFDETRANVAAVEAAYMQLQQDPNNADALAALKAAREEMRASIKEGVMNDALTDNAEAKSNNLPLKALLVLPAAAAIWAGLQKPQNGAGASVGAAP